MPVSRSRGNSTSRSATGTSSATDTSSETTTTSSSGSTATGTTAASQTSPTAVTEEAPGPEQGKSPAVTLVPQQATEAPPTGGRKRHIMEMRAALAEAEEVAARAKTEALRARLAAMEFEEEAMSAGGNVALVEDWAYVQTTLTCERLVEDAPSQSIMTQAAPAAAKAIAPPAPRITNDYHQPRKAVPGAMPTAPAAVVLQQPPKYMRDLPVFDGNSDEWLPFKAVYEDTAPLFSDVQNVARLRLSLKGTARETTRSILYTETSPEEIMKTLQRRFGRPDKLVLSEMDRLRKLSKIGGAPNEVCEFACKVNNSVAAIKALKRPQYLHSPEIVNMIIERLPEVMQFQWDSYSSTHEDCDEPEVIKLVTFLNDAADRCAKRVTVEELYMKCATRSRVHTTVSERPASSVKGEQSYERRPQKPVCGQCKGEHTLPECRQFIEASVQDRWETAKKLRVCFKCLRSRHQRNTCRAPSCHICKRWHHKTLHDGTKEEENKPTSSTNLITSVNTVTNAKAYLKIAPVKIYGPKGSAKIMALLDEGSTVTLLDANVAKAIGATGPKEPLAIETMSGQRMATQDSMRLDLKIKGEHRSERRRINGVRTIDNIQLAPQSVQKSRVIKYPHLKNIAEQLQYEGEPPKLLIGQDNWALIVTRAIRKGKADQPVASLTALGWVLHGCDAGIAKTVNFVNNVVISPTADIGDEMTAQNRGEDLDRLIKEHFAIESLGVQSRRPSNDIEGRVLVILEKISRRLPDGRFETGLIWKSEDETMPESYKAAENRLRNIERKLDRDPALKTEYTKQIQHLLDSGYAEKALTKCTSSRKWYLPHFAVTHPTKKKIRIVFDAAAKVGGKCLNDALLPGPDLLQSLFGVLMRFRQGRVAVVADIKEMFLQIRIRAEDRDSLRFLWREDDKKRALQEYRMTSVIFGATSSPSTAIYVKNKNAAEFEADYPEAVRAIEKSHYMDDYLQAFESTKEAAKIASEVDNIHKKAGFELRGWASNQPEVLQMMGKKANEDDEIELGQQEEKTLGLRWIIGNDTLAFRVTLSNAPEDIINGMRAPTKREVTSAVMSTFDPLGLVSPVLIQGKKLIQNIWRSGIGWDEAITSENEDAWKTYLHDLGLLKDLHIPRCVSPIQTEGELHVFTDASETAYAAAVYWRIIHEGQIQVSLLAAKARVTPLKPVSVPRLELQAALLGTRLAESTKKELGLESINTTFWTDSSTVLSWIRADPRNFKAFVAHRLAELEETTSPQQWRWVPTKQNPADDATRGIPVGFDSQHRWFIGPPFLYQEREHWPENRKFKPTPTDEEKPRQVMVTIESKIEDVIPNPERFSSWDRLCRTTARMLQFIDLCRQKVHGVNAIRRTKKKVEKDPTWSRNKKKTKKENKEQPKPRRRASRITDDKELIPLNPLHLIRAERIILQICQKQDFVEEIDRIRKGLPLSMKSKLKRLDVREQDGLLRLWGRIDAAPGIIEDYKRPIILNGRRYATRLLVERYHKILNHGNHETVMNELRQRYWIIGLRSVVRHITRNCGWCHIHRAKPQQPPTGDLPLERLRHGVHPFTCSAVDYFGPMMVTIGRRHEKRWGALFVCLTTRAIHIELASSLSTDSMILALRRMAARRGLPRILYSDNGTNFVGANRELKEEVVKLRETRVATEAERLGVTWKFIPPGAPHMGGAWERLVRSVKAALAVTLKETHPKEEVLHTLLLEAEHIVNSRPLTDVDVDLEAKESITPNHLLIGRSCAAPRLGIFDDTELRVQPTWKTAQRLADNFWSRWVKEYLPTLLPHKLGNNQITRNPECGDIVLIADSTLPRGTWPRGTISKIYPGTDGRVRVVDVRTSGGTLRRPTTRIVVLVPRTSPEPVDGAAHEGEDVGDENKLS